MGWAFEYLEEELEFDVQQRLGCGPASIELDDHLTTILQSDVGEPKTGTWEGVIKILDDHEYTINFVIKRKMPDDGLEYIAYEHQYEVVLNWVKSILKEMTTTVAIYLADLSEEKQKEVLEAAGVETGEEMNAEMTPIAIFEADTD